MKERIIDLRSEPQTEIQRFVGEFWTSKQRQASSLHEISYRACFKPQLPHFFIERFSSRGNLIYDPFLGRGTTIIEAALMNRNVIGNDINPLSTILTQPRLLPPTMAEVQDRLAAISISGKNKADFDLSMFFHPRTEHEIVSLRKYLLTKEASGTDDRVDRWIRMVATNRLTGHSPGFFSVYTLPPNQATTPTEQRRINAKRKQMPEYRNSRELILRKTASLLKSITDTDRDSLRKIAENAQFLSAHASQTFSIASGSVQLVVTSPPFLDIVQYSKDNWLRCWFNDIDDKAVAAKITTTRSLAEWTGIMSDVFLELHRIVRPGGHIAFEVGEIRKGTIKLEESILPIGQAAGFQCEAVYINTQNFTKTANIWGVANNISGTNTNRIVLFQKPQ